MARHAVKVILTFALLDRERLSLEELPDFIDRVPLFADFNARYLHMTTPTLTAWLVDELSRSGAAQVDNGVLLPRARR